MDRKLSIPGALLALVGLALLVLAFGFSSLELLVLGVLALVVGAVVIFGRAGRTPPTAFSCALVVAVVLTVASSGCGSNPQTAIVPVPAVAAGQDPIIVNAERLLRAAPDVYDWAMKWYYANASHLGKDAKATFEVLRKKTPPAWRAVDSANEAYIAAKSPDSAAKIVSLTADLDGFLTQLQALVPSLGGPALPAALAPGGGGH